MGAPWLIGLLSLFPTAPGEPVPAAAALASANAPLPPAANAADAHLAFAVRLIAAHPRPSNFAVSPHNVATVLAMVRLGAEGATAAELDATLGWPAKQDAGAALMAATAAMAPRFDSAGADASLVQAQRLWVSQTVLLNEPFAQGMERRFGAPPARADFGQPVTVAAEVNRWVGQTTRQHVPRLLAPGDVHATPLILASATWMKAPWGAAFARPQRRPAPFTVKGGKVQVATLSRRGVTLPHAITDTFEAVEVPYSVDGLGLVLLLPRAAGAFEAPPTRLEPPMREALGALAPREMNISFPEFHFDTAFDLQASLEAAGLRTAFGPQAEFGAMARAPRLAIGHAAHRACITVDVAGTEAGAATAVGMTPLALRRVQEVHIDRPFWFLVRDRQTQAVLFAGAVHDPRGS